MKIIEKEQTIICREYEAADGTIFDSKEKCIEYEKTVECVLMARYKSLVLLKSSDYELFGIGSDDSPVDILKVNDSEDIKVVLEAYSFANRVNTSNERMQEINKSLMKAMDNDDYVFIGRGYDEDCFWFEGTGNEIIEKLEKLDETIKKKQENES